MKQYQKGKFCKLSVKQQKEIISDDAIRKVFLAREDISVLPATEQEKRWKQHLKCVNNFRRVLSKFDSIVLG